MQKVERIKKYYEPNLKEGIPDHKMLGWESREAQYLRFAMFADAADIKGKSLLDIGCGLGNLLDYFNDKGIGVQYTGVDILDRMVDMASKRHPEAKFLCADIFECNLFGENAFDAVYASGIFNLNLGNNRGFLTKALDVMLKLSRTYVAFNLLHYQSPDREDKYFYFEPAEVVGLLKSLPYRFESIEVKEGYLKNDFTVVCRKSSQV